MKEASVELVENTFAVRYRDKDAERTVAKMLRAQGKIQAMKPQRLLIVEFPDETHCTSALPRLNGLMDQGLIEFVTPVLRDQETQLRQILTDEITVRFKSKLDHPQLEAVASKHGVRVSDQNEFVPNQYIFKVTKPKGLATLDISNLLNAADEVEFATPNFISEYRR